MRPEKTVHVWCLCLLFVQALLNSEIYENMHFTLQVWISCPSFYENAQSEFYSKPYRVIKPGLLYNVRLDRGFKDKVDKISFSQRDKPGATDAAEKRPNLHSEFLLQVERWWFLDQNTVLIPSFFPDFAGLRLL